MVKVRKNGGVVEIKDYLTKLYLRNGYELVTDEPMPVADEPKEVRQPKKRKAKK